MRLLDAEVGDEGDEAADEVARGERDAADPGGGGRGGCEVVVVFEQVGGLLLEGEGAELGEESGGEGGGVVAGPDPLCEQGGCGRIVDDHAFDLAALAVVF